MGLDSYIIKRCDLVNENANHMLIKNVISGVDGNRQHKGMTLETNVAYWRKFLPLHQWFQTYVEAYGNGIYYIDLTDFQELLTCLMFQVKHMKVDVFTANCDPEYYANDFEDAIIKIEDIIRDLTNKDRELEWKYYYKYEG